jgi:hypothetical protein
MHFFAFALFAPLAAAAAVRSASPASASPKLSVNPIGLPLQDPLAVLSAAPASATGAPAAPAPPYCR